MSTANTFDADNITHNIPEIQAALRALAQACYDHKNAAFLAVHAIDGDGDAGLHVVCLAQPEWPLNKGTLLNAVLRK